MNNRWQFAIDVGGTFTDCVARSPAGVLLTFKTLSSGVTPGIFALSDRRGRLDTHNDADTPGAWIGYGIRFLDDSATVVHETRISASHPDTGIEWEQPIPDCVGLPVQYEIQSPEEVPVFAIRRILKLKLDEPISPIDVRLGTTRGTNALLERKGAKTTFITTRGFADTLLIGNQDRPRLFDLNIRKLSPLFSEVVEIDERLNADGSVLLPIDADAVHRQLATLKESGVESIAVCLLHAYRNRSHEDVIAKIASDVGFTEISLSSDVAPRIKLVSRGDTTVLDAFLNPILRRFVTRIRESLGSRSTLKLMTSSGGLVDADRFRGADSLLSGPAGGVVGYARVAEQAGFSTAIGFDMGGTSTDVSRYAGRFDLDFETHKAGVRVMTPTLAIETVAAGGGSVCRFNGVTLSVGPESAGADPGPACYGRGGPLTITDVNLFLGRIPVSEFPFPLDRDAVERRLTALCDDVADSPLGRRYSPTELATGLIDIANENMTRAIRRISVVKGYDPADDVLVTFGGAGGQHACAIARRLGMRQILVHPYAGILSAYGIGLADIRRHRETHVLQPLDPDRLAELESSFVTMETSALADVRREGIAEADILQPLRSLDLRYVGVEATINVPLPTDGDYRAEYERRHQQLYGYLREDRAIEIATARVEVVGRTPQPTIEQTPARQRRPKPTSLSTATFDNAEQECGLFHRRDLQSGDEIVGPAILCEPTSTLVIDPGFTAIVTSTGDVLLTDIRTTTNAIAARPPASHDTADPVQVELFNNQFASIAEQMGITLQQTALSTNVKERLDFSCAVFDRTGRLVVNAPHIPVHLGAMSETVKRILADTPDLRPGEVFVTNDPYRGGSHLPDVTVITPVHDETGQLVFVTASRAHHAEIGGVTPGSMPPFSKSLAEEGVLIRNFKLIKAVDQDSQCLEQKSQKSVSRAARGGADSFTLPLQLKHQSLELRDILSAGPYPSRNPDENLADMAAQVAANQTGVRLLHELVEQHSQPTVLAYMGHIQRAAAEKMRLALSHLDDGQRTFTDSLDDGSLIKVTITIEGSRCTVDFTGTGPVLSTNFNANRAIVTAAVMYVFRCLLDEDIPLNDGLLEPITIILPECLLNPPEQDDPANCAAIVGGNVETSQRVVDVLLGALGVAAASQGTMNNLTFGNETFGYYETICGGSGATADADGADAVHTHMTNTRLTDAEIIEHRYPVRIREFRIRPHSGGDGRHRGGDGVIRRIEFIEPLQVSLLTQRRGPYTPFGLQGGEPGMLGCNTLCRNEESLPIDLGGCTQIDVAAGDVLTIETPGGGGFGVIIKENEVTSSN